MVEMFDPITLNGYMIQVRLQALTEPLADIGYDNYLIMEEYGRREIRIYREDMDKTFVIDYVIIFDDEDRQKATGFTLRLHMLEQRQLEVTINSSSGPVIATREEGLALNELETVDWIEEHMNEAL